MTLDDDLTEEELAELAENGSDEEKQDVAKHPNASLQTLRSLAEDGFATDVDQNPLLPLYVEAGSDDVIGVLMNVAEQTMRPERLEELASSPSIDVCFQVAINVNTPHHILNQFSVDKDRWLLRSGVASNRKAPLATLGLLAKDESSYVRRNVSLNESITAEIISSLAGDDDFLVLFRVATNLNTPHESLARLSNCKYNEVSRRAKENLEKIKKTT